MQKWRKNRKEVKKYSGVQTADGILFHVKVPKINDKEWQLPMMKVLVHFKFS